MKRIGTSQRKTRSKITKHFRKKGKISLSAFFQKFENGDRVLLQCEPAMRDKGMYFPRFMGKSGIISGKAGTCYQVAIKDQNKEKTLVIHPVHLRRLQNVQSANNQ